MSNTFLSILSWFISTPKFSQCVDFLVFPQISFLSSTLLFSKPQSPPPSGSLPGCLFDVFFHCWPVIYLKTILFNSPHLVKVAIATAIQSCNGQGICWNLSRRSAELSYSNWNLPVCFWVTLADPGDKNTMSRKATLCLRPSQSGTSALIPQSKVIPT